MKTLILFQNARKHELFEMAASLEAAGPVDGDVIIVASKYERDGMDDLVHRLGDVFSRVTTIPYKVSIGDQGEDAGTLLALFIQTNASSHPGPKLIVDDGFRVKDNEWLDQIRREHRAGGAKFTGRGKKADDGTFVPIGPFVLDGTPKDLEVFRIAGSIRERGKHLFGRDHNNLHFSRYPFTFIPSRASTTTSL